LAFEERGASEGGRRGEGKLEGACLLVQLSQPSVDEEAALQQIRVFL